MLSSVIFILIFMHTSDLDLIKNYSNRLITIADIYNKEFKDEPKTWELAYAYFNKAWDYGLDNLVKRIE